MARLRRSGTVYGMQTDTNVLTAPEPDMTWQENALCAQAGPEFFFPAPGSSTREAKQLCGACEGRVACLSTPSRTTSGSACGAGSRRRSGSG